MARVTQNLDSFERTLSAVFGSALSCLALRGSTGPGVRALAGSVGTFLLFRAATGHCAVKAALEAKGPRPETLAEPPTVGPMETSGARLDEALEGSFPASDPPASRLPDLPPRNAEDKWAAARKAESGIHDPGIEVDDGG